MLIIQLKSFDLNAMDLKNLGKAVKTIFTPRNFI